MLYGQVLGSAGTHFYRTEFGYDQRGRPNQMKSATGTIERTVYDGLGRPVSAWLGTNDDGATNSDPTGEMLDPDNNMKQVAASQYDNGGVGDSNLTRSIDYPSARPVGASEPADSRVTLYFYDWRNRLVASKAGAKIDSAGVPLPAQETDVGMQRIISYREYDNLDRVVAVEQYDGDGLWVIDNNGDGVPDKPWKDTDADGEPDQPATDRLRGTWSQTMPEAYGSSSHPTGTLVAGADRSVGGKTKPCLGLNDLFGETVEVAGGHGAQAWLLGGLGGTREYPLVLAKFQGDVQGRGHGQISVIRVMGVLPEGDLYHSDTSLPTWYRTPQISSGGQAWFGGLRHPPQTLLEPAPARRSLQALLWREAVQS